MARSRIGDTGLCSSWKPPWVASRNRSGRVSRLRLVGLKPEVISGQDLRVVVGRSEARLVLNAARRKREPLIRTDAERAAVIEHRVGERLYDLLAIRLVRVFENPVVGLRRRAGCRRDRRGAHLRILRTGRRTSRTAPIRQLRHPR